MTLSIFATATVAAVVLTWICQGAVRLMEWLDAWLTREMDGTP